MRESEIAALNRLHHTFEYRWDHGNRCVHFHEWLGGFVMCGLPENDLMHRWAEGKGD